ncbi:MAG TPA: LamG-like jellyroll fold domain-containing protein, partial [Chloroflexota bacterium]|nr:LamG-like jellyroll fold domain-containing protein [Chloroflexota bacterium]
MAPTATSVRLRTIQRSFGIQSITQPSAYTTAVQADGPYGWWRLGSVDAGATDEGNGGSVSDVITTSSNVTLQPGILAGDPDSAASFNGSSSYLKIGYVDFPSADLQLAPSDSFSVEMWVKPANTTQTGTLFAKTRDPDTFSVRILDNAGKAEFCPGSGTGTAPYGYWNCSTSAGSIPADRWTHLVFTYNGATKTTQTYINGQADPVTGSLTLPVSAAGTGYVSLGNYAMANRDYFNGLMDEVSFYRKVLPADRIAAHYWAGISGYALQFDGADDYLNVPLPVGSHQTAYTLEGWVKPSSTAAQNLMAAASAGQEASQFTNHLRINSSGRFEHYLTDNGIPKVVTGSTVVVPGSWYHVAAVAEDGGSMRLYVNGVEQGTPVAVADVAPQWTTGWYQAVGHAVGSGAWSSGYFQGTMDEVRFWGAARTPAQIAASYRMRTREREIGLLGVWQFDKGSGTTAVDSSAADGRDGTLVNGPLWVLSGAPLGIPTNSAPIAAGESYTMAEDTTLSVSAPGVLANDSDPDGDALDISLQSGPSHGTLALNANGSFNYTPTPNYNGTDSFTYKIGDGS